MAVVSNEILGALISQDLLLLASVFANNHTDEQERILVAIKLKTQIDLTNTTTEEIVNHANDLRSFQLIYQEFILDALDNDNTSVKQDTGTSLIAYRQFLGTLLIVISLLYVLALTWIPVDPDNQRFADTSLGFILATVISTVINFFYGNSEEAKNLNSNNQIKTSNKKMNLKSNTPKPPCE